MRQRGKPSRPFMLPWMPVGRRRRWDEASEGRLREWWETVAWTSLALRVTLPPLALWIAAWVRAAPVDPRFPGQAPLWWAFLAAVSAYDAWHLFKPCLVFLRALKERLYRRPSRIGADLFMVLAWAAMALAGVRLLFSGACGLRPPAAGLAATAGLLGLAFTGNFAVGLLGGGRTLRLTELFPERTEGFRGPAGFKGGLRLAHLSDLHLTERVGVPAVSGRPGGNAAFRALLAVHMRILTAQDAIVLSGDLTDAGRAGEWKEFFRGWDALKPGRRGVLVPGNHDLNIIDPGDRAAADPAHVLRAKRLVRTLAALDRVQGDRAWVWTEGGPGRLRVHLARHAPSLRRFIEEPDLGTGGTPRLRLAGYVLTGLWTVVSADARAALAALSTVWEESFPMLVELPGQKAMALVLDSNVAATGLWDNALGEMRPEQLRRMRLLCSHPRFRDRPKLVLLHHHVALPRLDLGFLRGLQADLMSLLNPRDLVAALPQGRQVILHGHKHLSYFGLLARRIQVVSAPSSTLGDERRPARGPGFYTLELAFDGAQAALSSRPRFHRFRG